MSGSDHGGRPQKDLANRRSPETLGGRILRNVAGVLIRRWVPLVMVAVLLVGGFAVQRIREFFGSEKRESYSDGKLDSAESFNPTRLVYEIFGPPGTVADIDYFDVNAEPQLVENAALPWSLRITTNKPAVTGNIVAQGNSESIGCRIVVDGTVKAERISNEHNAYTFCLVKSA